MSDLTTQTLQTLDDCKEYPLNQLYDYVVPASLPLELKQSIKAEFFNRFPSEDMSPITGSINDAPDRRMAFIGRDGQRPVRLLILVNPDAQDFEYKALG